MNPKSFEARSPIYKELYTTLKIRSDYPDNAEPYIQKIMFNRNIYEEVGLKTGVPWYFIACLHGKEASFNMTSCLHNGQPWNQKTTLVPRDRGPWSSWSEAAIDALIFDGLHLIKNWSIESTLWAAEKYNGFGYMKYGVNTPYLWSGSFHYSKGLFKEAPIIGSWYDENGIADDLGIAVLLKTMEEQGIIQLKFESNLNSIPDVVKEPIQNKLSEPSLPVQQSKISFLSRFLLWLKFFIDKIGK